MGGIDTMLQLALLVLLGATLLHAVRLQRALSGLRGDRAALHDAVAGFDDGTRQAEAASARLQGLIQALAAQHDRSTALRDDLAYLSDRGETLADRLDAAVRTARGLGPVAAAPTHETARDRASNDGASNDGASNDARHPAAAGPLRSQAERNLLVALQGRR